MKPLKFRAWHDGLMYSVYHIEFNELGASFVEMRNYEAKALFHTNSIGPDALMQFTGLLDKHGHEVYKSDILRVEASATGTVIEGQGGFIIAFTDGHRLSFEDVASENIEIAGNIYETKKGQ